jgi:hypothetical protein
MMAFIGVRISWLMLARKRLLARLAFSADSLADGKLDGARDRLALQADHDAALSSSRLESSAAVRSATWSAIWLNSRASSAKLVIAIVRIQAGRGRRQSPRRRVPTLMLTRVGATPG